MTNAQCRKLDSLTAKLVDVREQLSALADEVALSDYREGSNLSHGVDAVESALGRFLGAAGWVPA
jgi:hypothetical protein